jgi:hypothetical protein
MPPLINLALHDYILFMMRLTFALLFRTRYHLIKQHFFEYFITKWGCGYSVKFFYVILIWSTLVHSKSMIYRIYAGACDASRGRCCSPSRRPRLGPGVLVPWWRYGTQVSFEGSSKLRRVTAQQMDWKWDAGNSVSLRTIKSNYPS